MTALGLRSLQEWQDSWWGDLRAGEEIWLYRFASGKLYWQPADDLEEPLAYAVVQ